MNIISNIYLARLLKITLMIISIVVFSSLVFGIQTQVFASPYAIPNPTGSNVTSGNPVSTNPVPTPTTEPVQPTTKIPHWVKTVFNLYGQGQVSDDDLISALKFLIQTDVIKVS